MRILIINGSYRPNGLTDKLLAVMADTLKAKGAEVEELILRENPIEFCLNCRECTQIPSDTPVRCVQDDGFNAMVERIEAADAYILAAPTNFYTVTALFKRFLERLVVYGYWPWGMPAPKFRKPVPTKKAVVFSTAAAPAFLARLVYRSLPPLKDAAKTIGAHVRASGYFGFGGMSPSPTPSSKAVKKAQKMAAKLL